MKYVYVGICVLFLSLLSFDANSEEGKEGHGKMGETQSAIQLAREGGSMSERATEVRFRFGTKFPHVPGPISRAKKWTFSQPVASAILLLDNSSPYCIGLNITAADNVVYVVAKFQAQWDTTVYAAGTFLVTFKSATFESVDIDPDSEGTALGAEIAPGAERSHCDGLTTKGKCWTGRNCNGTLTSSSTSCANCRDNLQGKSFESLNTGHCYPTE